MNNIHNSNIGSSSASIGTPIPGVVGWTFEDAAQENKHIARERRIARLSRKPRAAVLPAVNLEEDTLEAETGWTRADALEVMLECRRDARLFGRRRCH
ncbi:MAG: hypothetical protein IPI39_09525 [Candidatus Obscuribacter sp.]|nr:hypothetical protein [Candidatus Obscuribacter sp.]